MSQQQKIIDQKFSSHNLQVLNHLIEPSDKDLHHQYLNTNQQMSEHQRLFGFISDKGKISLKSYFDQKGSIDFFELNERSNEKNRIK